MTLTTQLHTPGTHALLLQGPIGPLEVELTVPEHANPHYVAVLGHPHSLQGGTMHNKVVTTLVRIFRELNIASVRFNFRGVGLSGGEFAAGVGESEDMLWLTQQCLHALPEARVIFAGFSFGSYVAYRAAAHCPHQLLITIAPSIAHYDYTEFTKAPAPWIIVQGDNDEVVPAQDVFAFAAETGRPLLRFAETGHFFHGKLIELKVRLLTMLNEQITDL